MKSDGRNLAFNAFTGNFSKPKDPRPYLGEDLFELLVQSPEVTDGSRTFDWGHAIIGMDARRRFSSRGLALINGSTGLESVTWIGDLGGGAGKLAWDRVNHPNTRALDKFRGSHFGGRTNLEGDIGGYLIGREKNVNYTFRLQICH